MLMYSGRAVTSTKHILTHLIPLWDRFYHNPHFEDGITESQKA